MLIIGMLPCYRSICQVVSESTLMPVTTSTGSTSAADPKPTFQQTQSFQNQ